MLFSLLMGMFSTRLALGKKHDSKGTSLEGKTPVNGKSSAYFHFSQARVLEESGDFLKAIEEYKKAIQLDPQSSSLYIELANAYLRHRRVRDAIQEAENAVKVNPDSLEAHKLLGSIYFQIIKSEEPQRSPASSDYLKKAIQEYLIITRLDSSDTNSLITLGLLYRYDGQAEKATETVKKVLELAPSNEMGLTTLAQIYSEQGNPQEAINVFKRALEINPDSPRILAELAFAYEQAKDYKNSIQTYRKAIEADEDSLELSKRLAEVLLEDNQDVEAEKAFLKILEADPDEGRAYFRLGQIYRSRKDFEKALNNFNKASSILVGSFEVSFHIATLYEELGKFEKAEERFQQLLKLTEKPSGSYSASEIQNRSIFLTHAGYIAQQLEKYPQAIAYFTDLKTLNPENALKAESYIVDVYRTAKQFDKALSIAESAVKANPKDKDFNVLYQDLLSESGESVEALKNLQEMLSGTDDDLKVYTAMVQIYQRGKKFKEAEKTLFMGEKYFKNKEAFHFMLGAIYERQKEFDKAEATFRKILEMNPSHAQSLNYLGYMLADRGVQLQESVELIKRALEIDPNNGAYLDSLGWAYFKLNRLEEAETYLKKALDRVRKDPTVHVHLGDVYYKKGQYEEARSAWELCFATSQDDEEIRKVQKKMEELKIKLASLEKK